MIDLHIHSKNSLDAKSNINDILNKCEETGVTLVSITDHNTVKSYYEIEKETKFTGNLIAGMEADAIIDNITLDFLCYGFNIENINKWAQNQYKTIEERQNIIFEKLIEKCKTLNCIENKEYSLKNQFAHQAIYEIIKENENGKSILEKYNINNSSELYRIGTTNNKFPLYIDMHIVWPSIEKLKEVINKNGGKIFLAHPYHYNIPVEKLLSLCKDRIDGIEIFNFKQTKEETQYLYNYAKQNNLMVSVGNDYHNKDEHIILGVKDIEKNIEKEIEAWGEVLKLEEI